MIYQFYLMEDEVSKAARALEDAKVKLAIARKACSHSWDDPKGKYLPIRTEGYRTPNMMGHFTVDVDGHVHAPEVWVPPTETPRWTRTCTICGLQETTEKTTETVVKTPSFR